MSKSRLALMIVFLAAPLLTLFLAAGARAGDPLKLFVNDREVVTDIPPQLINGRTMVPVRWIAEGLGAEVTWDEETRTVKVFTGDWLPQLGKLLARAEEELANAPDTRGEIKRIWKIGDNQVLLEHVWAMDYDYYLGNLSTGQKDRIVSFVENARVEKAGDREITFIAKGGSDCGNYTFPYLLRYDLKNKEMSTEQMYLQRDVTFGTSGAWAHLLKEVSVQEGWGVLVDLEVAPDQILAGGHKTPLTVVNYHDNLISLRIYGVTCSKTGDNVLKPADPVIERIEWEALPADEPVENPALLQMDFPYGAALKSTDIHEPSVVVKIFTREEVAYNIATRTMNTALTYAVKFK